MMHLYERQQSSISQKDLSLLAEDLNGIEPLGTGMEKRAGDLARSAGSLLEPA